MCSILIMKVFNKPKETNQKPTGGFLIAHFKRSATRKETEDETSDEDDRVNGCRDGFRGRRACDRRTSPGHT